MQNFSRALLSLTMMGLAACSGIGADESSGQSHEVQGGTKDVASHSFAVGIASRTGSVCTGTLIAPNLVLTARHCVEEKAPDGEKKAVDCTDTFRKNTATTNLFVTTEPVIRGAKVLYPVTDIATPSADTYCGNDIALLRLGRNIPSSEAIPAIPVVQFSIGDQTRLSGKIAALGYGITAPNAADPGTRRIRQKIDILCLPGDDSYDCTTTIYSSMMDNDREFITQGYVCSGDSGGGAFDQGSLTKGGTPYVLGALSRGPQTDTQCLAAIYSRTDKHADLIIAAAKEAALAGGYTAPGWATGAALEEPSSDGSAEGCEGDICTSTDATEPTAEAPATQTITTTTGCTAAPGARAGVGSALLLSLAVGAVVARRRKR